MAYLREHTQKPVRGALAVPLAVSVALQLVVAPQISLAGGTFNFLAAAVCALAPGLEPPRAVLLGFSCGLAYDLLTSTSPVGLMALLLTVTAFALSSATSGRALGPTPDGIRLTAVAALAAQLACGLALFLLGASSSFLTAVGVHGLATGLMTALAAAGLLFLAPRGESGRGFSAKGSGGTRFKGV